MLNVHTAMVVGREMMIVCNVLVMENIESRCPAMAVKRVVSSIGFQPKENMEC